MAIGEILRLRSDVELLKAVVGEALTVGTVAKVDTERGYRIDLGEGNDGPMLSPWIPHPESGGQSLSWMPLSEGQIVALLSPSGDLRQGVMLRGGFGGEYDPPSQDLAANVLKAFGIIITMKDGKVSIEGDVDIKGDVKIEGDQRVEGDVDFAEGHVQHNDTNIGDTHQHDETMPGIGLTGEPVD